MSDLSKLRRPEGAHRDRKRLGRGPGSGKGKTAGKGHKGQKARAGHHGIPAWFEGGQMPLQRRLPKRGFTNPFRTVWEIVNLRDIAPLDEEEVTPEVLDAHRLIDLGRKRPVKVLGEGEIGRAIRLQVHAVSAGARAKIEAAGGSIELLER
jgi:large subunit ribosomal protein L15